MCVWPSTGKLLCWTWRRRPPSRWWWSSNLSSSTAPGCFQKVCGRTAAAFCLWPKPALTDLLCGRGRFADHLSLSYQLRLERPVLSPRRAVFRRPFPLIAAANHWAHREVMLPLYQCIHSAAAAEAVRPQQLQLTTFLSFKASAFASRERKAKKNNNNLTNVCLFFFSWTLWHPRSAWNPRNARFYFPVRLSGEGETGQDGFLGISALFLFSLSRLQNKQVPASTPRTPIPSPDQIRPGRLLVVTFRLQRVNPRRTEFLLN